MKSRITIEIDFDNQRKPVIQILSRQSDDIRDKMVSDFLQLLGHESTTCNIKYVGESNLGDDRESFKRWIISPVEPN